MRESKMRDMTKKMDCKQANGITLVALVVTIIVLLILAGVTISLVLGQAGIFSKAGEAKDRTTESQAIEKVRLAVLELRTENNGSTQGITLEGIAQRVEGGAAQDPKEIPGIIVVDGIKIKVDENFQATIEGKAEGGEIPTPPEEEIELPSTAETTPYATKSSVVIEGTSLDNGLAIKDKNNNEWAWVEVPKSVTASAATDEQIETALKTYAADYRDDRYYADTWYDGCGLTESEYNSNKSKMLKSIKANGGFWIGRYEVGTDTLRTTLEDALTTPLVQQDKYVYNCVTFAQAQELASQLSPVSNYTSSMLFGIQWDLTCKYMEEKGYMQDNTKMTKADLLTDSMKWGNYEDATFEITRGKYSTERGETYTDVTSAYTKPVSQGMLLTTGASERNKVLNIYDFTGNTRKCTLEKGYDGYPCVTRGGYCYNYGRGNPSTFRMPNQPNLGGFGGTPSSTLYK